MSLSCLLAIRSVLYRRIVRLPARSTSGAGRWRFFVSVAASCCLPWLGCERGGAFLLVGVARCCRVDNVGWRRGSRRPVACCGSFYRAGVSRSPRCLLRHRRRVSSWADRHRMLPSWLRLVVGCRGSSSSRLLAIGGGVVIRVSPVGRPPLIVSLIVSPLVLSPCLACRVAGRLGVAAFPPSPVARAVCLCG